MPGLKSLGLALSLLLLIAVNNASLGSEKSPSNLAAADAGSLVDQYGRSIDLDSLQGRYQLFVFGYTYCPDVCPMGLNDVAEVLYLLGDDAQQVTPVFVTIDPARDTPEVLAEYVTHFDSRIIAITGNSAKLEALAQSFGVASFKMESDSGRDEYYYGHSAYKYLVTPSGQGLARFEHEVKPAVIAQVIAQQIARRVE